MLKPPSDAPTRDGGRGNLVDDGLPDVRGGPEWLPPYFDEMATLPDSLPLIQTSGEFVAGFVPPDYSVDGLLQRRFFYSLTGSTGSGKTTLALLLSARVARGLPFAGREVEAGRVLFFAGENPDDIRMRWLLLAEAEKFDVGTIDVHFVPGRFSLASLGQHVRAEVQKLGGVTLLIIDTSAAYFEGDSENDNVQAGNHARLMRAFTDLEGGPTVIANCHPVKNASQDNMLPRGGGAFIAEVDGNLTCVKSDMTATLHWQGKFRGPDFAPSPFELVSATAPLLRDSKGRAIYTVYARTLSDTERREKDSAIRSDEDAVLSTLLTVDYDISVAGIAEALRWLTPKGEPYKSKVQRALDRLKSDKLVTKERGSPKLTAAGEKAAKKANYNRQTAGSTYG